MKRHEHGHLGWIDLMAADVEGQSSFYEALFGWDHHDEPTFEGGPPYRMFAVDSADVAAAGPTPPDMAGMPTMWVSYVIVDDVDVIAERALDLGGRVTMPIMDVMESGRMLGVTDPTGAAIFFWQPKEFEGAGVYGVPGALVWNDLNTRDLDAAAAFYEALLGWDVAPPDEQNPDYRIFTTDGESEGGMMRMGDEFPPEVPAHWLPYFAVGDARATVERAKELGGKAEMDPMEIDVCVFCVLSDPAGAVFAVMEMREA